MGFAEAEWLRRNAASGIASVDSSFSVCRNTDFSASILFDASDLEIEGQLVGIVRTLTVVRNRTSPKSRNDGDTVVSLDRGNLHKYKDTPYKDSSAPKDEPVFYSLFVETEGNAVKKTQEVLLSAAGTPSAMSMFEAVPSPGGYVALYMDVPDSVPSPKGGEIETAGYVVRKGSSGYPETSEDGSFVITVDREHIHQYRENPFIDGSTFVGNTYYYRAFPFTSYGSENLLAEENSASVIAGTSPKAPDSFSVKNFSSSDEGKIKVSFKLLDNTVKDEKGHILTMVDRMAVRARTNQYPENNNDGEEVCSAILTVGTDISFLWDCEKNTSYYIKLFLRSEDGIWSSFDSCQSLLSTVPCVYGFRVKKAESSPSGGVEYMDDSVDMIPMHMDFSEDVMNYGSWGDSWIFSKFRPVMLRTDGTVDYELDREDQTKKKGVNLPSDVFNVDYEGNAMVGMKTIYTRCWQDPNYKYVQIADYKKNESFRPFAHEMQNGGIFEEVFLPMFEGSKVNSVLRSIAGRSVCSDIPEETGKELAEANGSGWGVDVFQHWKMIELLLILLGKSQDSASVYGNGHTEGATKKGDLLETGTLVEKGMFYGTNGTDSAVKVFWLENYYGNRWDLMGDISLMDSTFTVAGGYEIPAEISGTSGGCQSAHQMTEFGIIPMEANGSETTYVPDSVWFVNSPSVAYSVYKGGDAKSGRKAGISAMDISHETTFSSWSAGPSVSYRREEP